MTTPPGRALYIPVTQIPTESKDIIACYQNGMDPMLQPLNTTFIRGTFPPSLAQDISTSNYQMNHQARATAELWSLQEGNFSLLTKDFRDVHGGDGSLRTKPPSVSWAQVMSRSEQIFFQKLPELWQAKCTHSHAKVIHNTPIPPSGCVVIHITPNTPPPQSQKTFVEHYFSFVPREGISIYTHTPDMPEDMHEQISARRNEALTKS